MKNILLIFVFILFSTKAFSYSCPMLWEELDYEINSAKNSGVSSEKIKKIQKLRDDGVKAHDNGNHEKSEELLNKALEMIKS
mgnify:FL=1|tara:strand:+ start:183 stop:428 length:246 start_codon:yes stop_codon:yes gene_type:complete